MGKKRGQLEELEARFQELKTGIRDCIAKCEALAQQGRRLQAELRTAPPAARPGIREELKDLQAEYDRVRTKQSTLASKKAMLAPKVVAARRDLRAAQQTLGKIQDPPPWGLGDYSPDTLRQIEQRARQVIRELMG